MFPVVAVPRSFPVSLVSSGWYNGTEESAQPVIHPTAEEQRWRSLESGSSTGVLLLQCCGLSHCDRNIKFYKASRFSPQLLLVFLSQHTGKANCGVLYSCKGGGLPRILWLNSTLQCVMLSPCKRPDPIYRNPSSQDGPDHKLLAGVIIGLSIHVVMVFKINAAGAVKAHMKTVKRHECEAKNAPQSHRQGVYEFRTHHPHDTKNMINQKPWDKLISDGREYSHSWSIHSDVMMIIIIIIILLLLLAILVNRNKHHLAQRARYFNRLWLHQSSLWFEENLCYLTEQSLFPSCAIISLERFILTFSGLYIYFISVFYHDNFYYFMYTLKTKKKSIIQIETLQRHEC